MGGMAEMYEHVGEAAAEALRNILSGRSEPHPRVRETVFDLDQDDDRVATLLYYLGSLGEPLRQELMDRPEGRLRLRAARSVLSIRRTTDYVDRFLPDPDPAVRAEALDVPRNVGREANALRLLREDPAPEVRQAAVRALRFASVGSAPFVAAAAREDDTTVRALLLDCLAYRSRDGAEPFGPMPGHPDRPLNLERPVAPLPAADRRTGRGRRRATARCVETCLEAYIDAPLGPARSGRRPRVPCPVDAWPSGAYSAGRAPAASPHRRPPTCRRSISSSSRRGASACAASRTPTPDRSSPR
jgi:hypothetical protein